MDLGFIHHSPVNLALIASKTTTLQNLLRYLRQTQIHIAGEWKAAKELPARFISNLEEDLKVIPGLGVTQALYHTVVSGHFFPPVREWLVDSIADRGHKRWDKAVTTALVNLRTLVHENLLPSLERCTIILSRWLGLARANYNNEPLGFNVLDITRLLDTIASLMLLGHKILLAVMDELEHFEVFSVWLKLQIDQLTAPLSVSEELSEKEALLDHGKVLVYIETYLTSSPLAVYLDQLGGPPNQNDLTSVQSAGRLSEAVDQQLKRYESGSKFDAKLPNLQVLLQHLSGSAEKVFASIAETEKRSVRFGQPVLLKIGMDEIEYYDVRISDNSLPDGLDAFTYTVVSSKQRSTEVYLFRTGLQIVNGVSHIVGTEASSLSVGRQGNVVDLKFSDHHTVFILWSEKGKGVVIHSVDLLSTDLPWSQYDGHKPMSRPPHETSNLVGPVFTLPRQDTPFEPVGMEIREAYHSHGEDVPARLCLLGNDGQSFKVFALPGSSSG